MSEYDPNFVPTKQYAIVGQKVVVINNNEEILLLQRSDKAGAGGKWSIPGGGLDTGEKSIDGILRELKEEAKIQVKDLKPFHVKTYMSGEDFIVIIA
jgi:mutator protein MutT